MIVYLAAGVLIIWMITLLYFWFRPRCHVDSSTASRWFLAAALALIATGLTAMGL